jgi:hypothetical protein
MKRSIPLMLFCAGMAGFANAATAQSDDDRLRVIEPEEAIQRAAAFPDDQLSHSPAGVTGIFSMTVKHTGKVGSRFLAGSRSVSIKSGPFTFLDSEADFRDPHNLTIKLSSEVAKDLQTQLGAPPEEALKGKQILVSGTARRVKIDFASKGQPTGKSYYQTHIDVNHASQIKIL